MNEAMAVGLRALSVSTKTPTAVYVLGAAFAKRPGLNRNAARVFGALARAVPEHPMPHVLLAESLLGLQRYGQARHEYHAAVELDPTLVRARFGLAAALLTQGEYAPARPRDPSSRVPRHPTPRAVLAALRRIRRGEAVAMPTRKGGPRPSRPSRPEPTPEPVAEQQPSEPAPAESAPKPAKAPRVSRNRLFPVGVSLYPLDSETQSPEDWYARDLTDDLDALASARCSLVRIFVSWRILEPQVAQYSVEVLDRLAEMVAQISERKMQAIVVFFADDRHSELTDVSWGTKRDPTDGLIPHPARDRLGDQGRVASRGREGRLRVATGQRSVSVEVRLGRGLGAVERGLCAMRSAKSMTSDR